MYARINHVIAQSEMQLTITKTSPNKATLISVYPNKTIVYKAAKVVEKKLYRSSKINEIEVL